MPPSARDAACAIVRRLRDAGHVAYLAGGCVRDRLLGLEPKDYDVATDAAPDRVRELFPNARFVGEAFGVSLVRHLRHDTEVATFRTESGYHDGRRPSVVQYSDARSDAQRRDFTLNALFEDPFPSDESHRIIDYVGGLADLHARVLRAVGDPDQRLGEDYLRLLRAVRFAARFDLSLDPATQAALRRHAPDLSRITRERIGGEVRAMLTGARPHAAVTLLQDLGLDAPALNEPRDVGPSALLASLTPDADYALRLAAWLLDRQPPRPTSTSDPVAGSSWLASLHPYELNGPLLDAVQRWREAINLSNDETQGVLATLRALASGAAWPAWGVASRKRWLALPRAGSARALFAAGRASRPEFARLADALDAQAPALEAQGVAPAPFIQGHDLIALGLKPGPAFKPLLDACYDAQLELRVQNREAALELAKSLAKG